MRSASLLGGLFAVFALAGCGDDPPAQPVVSSQAAAAPASSASSASSGQPSAVTPPPVARREFPEADFTETERSRDPFRPYAKKFAEEAKRSVKSQRQVLLAEFSVDDLKLIGIVTRLEPARAMLVDPTGKGHVVRRGDFVGRADVVQLAGATGATYELNWRLDRIRDGDVVLVREDPNNPDVPAATKVIPLRPEGGVVTGG
ncbi:MAG TPA: pilus assembly protein PilP [Polyangiaceae bacterium]|nr:pilus assembly protein PilP [Polyangiaceae bacterium]